MPTQAKILSHHPPKFTIDVTAERIAAAVRGNSAYCMVSESIKVAKPGFSRVSTDIQSVRVTDNKNLRRHIYLTPRCIQQAIIDFDEGKDVKPFRAIISSGYTCESFHGKSTPLKPRTKAKQNKKKRAVAARKKELKAGIPPKAVGSRRVFGLRALGYTKAKKTS